METGTFIARDDGELLGVKEGAQPTETPQTRGVLYRCRNVHCRQVTSVTVESNVEVENGLMGVLSSVDLSEIW